MSDTNPAFSLTRCAQVHFAVQVEMASAEERYGPFHSTHEALGVLLEEFDELKAAIHANALESVRTEAIQVAAVALRLAAVCRGDAEFERRSTR